MEADHDAVQQDAAFQRLPRAGFKAGRCLALAPPGVQRVVTESGVEVGLLAVVLRRPPGLAGWLAFMALGVDGGRQGAGEFEVLGLPADVGDAEQVDGGQQPATGLQRVEAGLRRVGRGGGVQAVLGAVLLQVMVIAVDELVQRVAGGVLHVSSRLAVDQGLVLRVALGLVSLSGNHVVLL